MDFFAANAKKFAKLKWMDLLKCIAKHVIISIVKLNSNLVQNIGNAEILGMFKIKKCWLVALLDNFFYE